VSTVRLTAQQRLALGVVREVRGRRDAIRASFRVPPARGTPSALLGGPAPRSAARRSGGGAGSEPSLGADRATDLSARAILGRVRAGARRGMVGTGSVAAAQVDRVFLDHWRLATANGVQAERMYAAGATLELGAVAARRTASLEREGGGNVR
jgi:hypothetical protein